MIVALPDHNLLLERRGPLIAAHKRSGALVHNSAYAGPREDGTLVDDLEALAGRKLYPLHRIDRGTSGLVLCLDTRDDIGAWMQAFREEATRKEYLAIVRGHLRQSMRVERPVPNEHGELLDAASTIAPIACSTHERVSLVRVRIWTGRTHQVRRHGRSIGHPLVGDATWGNSKFNRALRESAGVDRLGLHAWRVAMTTPSGAVETFCAPPRADFAQWCAALFDLPPWEELRALPWLTEEADQRMGPDVGPT